MFIMSREPIAVRGNATTRPGERGAASPSWSRSGELACRTSWGSDLWEPRPGDFTIEVKIWGPFDPDAPLDDYPADLLRLLLDSPESSSGQA